ncbi:MAG TPA: ribonuclease HII [Pelomicrobium sp.]|nr:ribonuclease HII [Pelomicrobium sp.]
MAKRASRKQESIEAMRERLLGSDKPVSAHLLARLRRDARPGVQKIYAALKRRFERERADRLHHDALLHFERLLWGSGITRVGGVDEAGVGALAGPVVAAAVVFLPDTEIFGIDDSKRLDAQQREELAGIIRARAEAIGVGEADVAEIDSLNIYHASLLAMRRAVEALPQPPQHLLVDARTIPSLEIPQSAYAKGDGLNFSIAAASIIAKTHRDRLLTEIGATYPEYGFASHKGYDTPEHRAALERLGPCPAHRLSFPVIREICGNCSPLFYALRRELEAARDRAGLKVFEEGLAQRIGELDEAEARKLRVIAGRHWKALG